MTPSAVLKFYGKAAANELGRLTAREAQCGISADSLQRFVKRQQFRDTLKTPISSDLPRRVYALIPFFVIKVLFTELVG